MWWDREIPFGKPFDQVIEEALKNSRCIIVAWSKHSITSAWVIEEAQYGRDHEILVPVLIDDVAIPFGFRRLEAANLIEWNGKTSCAMFLKLVSDISATVGAAPKNLQDNQNKPTRMPRWKATFQKNPIEFLSTAIVIAIAFVVIVIGLVSALLHGEL